MVKPQWCDSHATTVAIGTSAIELLSGWLKQVLEVWVCQGPQHSDNVTPITPTRLLLKLFGKPADRHKNNNC